MAASDEDIAPLPAGDIVVLNRGVIHDPPWGPDEIAERLLLENLNQRQRREYVQHGWFEVRMRGPITDTQGVLRLTPAPERIPSHPWYREERVYRIGHCTNCKTVHVQDWCVHVMAWHQVPKTDHLLTIKTWIEGDEWSFICIANTYAHHNACLR